MLWDSFWYAVGSLALPAFFVVLIFRTVKKKNKREMTDFIKGFTAWEKVLLFFCILSLAIYVMSVLGLVPEHRP